VKQLQRRGVLESDAFRAAYCGRGPWRMAGSMAMNIAVPTSELRKLGLVMLVETQGRFAFST
jgi:hypothetical protein